MDVRAILRNAWQQACPVVGELAQFVRYETANGRCVARMRYEARLPDAPPGWRTLIGSEFVLDRISAQARLRELIDAKEAYDQTLLALEYWPDQNMSAESPEAAPPPYRLWWPSQSDL